LGFVNRLASNRNHVIFGRRGSGKSVLLRELETRLESSRTHTVLIDVEQIAQKSYPNLIIEILLITLRDLLAHTRAGLLNKLHLSRRNLAREIEAEIRRLESLYQKPDEVKQKVLEREQKESKTEFSEEISTIQSILRLAANLSNRKATEQAIEEEATWKKIGALFNSIGNYRALINKWLEEMGYDALYILVDDFYQIDLLHQPLIADYLKRLLRGIPCYLKVATVRNRSLLFVKDNLTEAGLQAAHDYTSLDLDFSLDDFSQARNFLSTILRNVCEGRLYNGPKNSDTKRGLNKVVKCHHAKTIF
jgi:energy-coupling factor transporter ATP-binding protein EcfA2